MRKILRWLPQRKTLCAVVPIVTDVFGLIVAYFLRLVNGQ